MKPEELARLRQDAAGKNSTPRFFANELEEDTIGAAGEMAFARMCGLEHDTCGRPAGDGGIDFEVKVTVTVDVKTARKPKYLLVKKQDIDRPVDIYVLAKYCEDKSVKFLGWTTRDVMRCQEVRDHGYGIESYTLHASQLRPMNRLLRRMGL